MNCFIIIFYAIKLNKIVRFIHFKNKTIVLVLHYFETWRRIPRDIRIPSNYSLDFFYVALGLQNWNCTSLISAILSEMNWFKTISWSSIEQFWNFLLRYHFYEIYYLVFIFQYWRIKIRTSKYYFLILNSRRYNLTIK